MGTRNLTMVRLNGKIRVAQYCQWDGYPTGQGAVIARFIQNELNLEVFKDKVKVLRLADNAMQDASWIDCGASPDSEGVNLDVLDYHAVIYPEFSRDTGAEILGLIQAGCVSHVKLDIDLLKAKWVCEYAYCIDLNKKTVELYHGSIKPIKIIPFIKFTPEYMLTLENEL